MTRARMTMTRATRNDKSHDDVKSAMTGATRNDNSHDDGHDDVNSAM